MNQEKKMIAQSDTPIHSFDTIATKFISAKEKAQSLQASSEIKAVPRGEPSVGIPFTLSPEAIGVPAVILSKELRLTWHNESAREKILQLVDGYEFPTKNADVFDLLLSARFQHSVHNWRQWVAFFIQQALFLVSADELERLFSQKSDPHSDTLLAMLTDFQTSVEQTIFYGRLRRINPSESLTTTYRVACMAGNGGRLILFEPIAGDQEDTIGPIQDTAGTLPSILAQAHEQPVRMVFYILSLSLNNAGTLAGEMLANEYARLLNRLWTSALETIEQYQGILSQYTPSGMSGYFMCRKNEAQTALDVIQCALDLKKRMGDLGREWKIQKGWLHDIELNMGIHTGREYLTCLSSSLGKSLVPLGDTLSVAASLSAVGRNGQIWSSKSVIDQLPVSELDALRFGIFRNDQTRQIFIPKCFSRMRDVTGDHRQTTFLEDEIGAHPVTQIFDYRGATKATASLNQSR